ncbi:hypothetical protein THIOM_005586 [Candidatus Thiomargarita nelsonii]|uniref:Uncharacterized protein n=1 Tax=Candidatus Thiomargarita nelsonii TaxID=1003181 RepID=A0A176RSW0_9GAMM|nr:hypothetical protein THIOM_005586 [Candidatus Thiomargarita nelsonii]
MRPKRLLGASLDWSSMLPSAGLRVSELKAEMIVATAIVSANWRKNCPVIPPMNAVGMNTALSTKAIEMSAVPTSSMVTRAASFGDNP